MCNLFFVYGTLKRGYGNHCILGKSEFLGNAKTIDSFVMVDGGFPYILEDEELPSFPVSGEIYRVEDLDRQSRLDLLEGVEYDHYIRAQRKVMLNEEEVLVNIYIASDSTSQHIKEVVQHNERNLARVESGGYVWGY